MKIFKFYASQHQLATNIHYSFDQITDLNSKLQQGDFLKFCANFDIPITKKDQMEVYRKISIRENKNVNFEVFQDLLKEMFYVKETEQFILLKQREIKMLEESNLRWSMEKKAETLKLIDDLQAGVRDKARDGFYLYKAHEYL